MSQQTIEMLKPLLNGAFPTVTVAYTTVGNTADYPPGPGCVWVLCTSAAYVLVGEGAVATAANGLPVAANIPVCLEVPKGTGAPWRVSVLQIATGGDLYAHPLGN